ncbi:MAG: hypothetical protein CL920_33365 [Deltaproteobacteria bacterium]|nr:hypothetical protein [Deltaproteobacteria bacterium]MBU53614.1 hypothetical protein [Deltaproteobacteria bacterium]|tara:strand:+ start:2684 stop:3094 length:411 start_codon:yes stop_codon:yes gene_type:complete
MIVRLACLLICALAFVGCAGAPAPEISLRISEKALVDLDKVDILIGAVGGGNAASCDAYLSKTTVFSADKFTAEKTQAIALGSATKQEVVLSDLQPGEKLFVIAGYQKGNLVMLGCDKGTIEDGKKLMLSIAMLAY